MVFNRNISLWAAQAITEIVSMSIPPINSLSAKDNSGSAVQLTIRYGPNANASTVSDYSETVIKAIMLKAGVSSLLITSTARTATDQARAMFNNLERKGVDHQKKLYGKYGDQVIDIYDEKKKSQASAEQIKNAMVNKINKIGPSRVSKHAADTSKLNVIDIAPSSIPENKRQKFAMEVKAEARVSKFIEPPKDPAYHIEIPQKAK